MPVYCPVCQRYSDKFVTTTLRDQHIIDIHPDSQEAKDLTERRRKGFAQTQELGKTMAPDA